MFAASKSGGVSAPTDPDFEHVTLLLPGNGTNGAQNNTFLDGSTNNFTITRNGNTTQGTFSPYGSNWSNYFNGTNAFLTVGNTGAAGALSTGNFTVECWVNIASNTALQIIVDARGQNQVVAWQLYTSATGKVVFQYGAGTITGATTVSTGVWTHIAVVRSGSAITLYVNGVSDGTATSSADISGGSTFYVGRTFDTSGTLYYSGYISNLRVVIGSAVYTTGFTPSTAPLTAITNTALLTCQSNRFVDNSTNAYAITVSGGSSVQRFSPFSPTAAYTAATIGGSAYFPATTDFLQTPSITFGTNAFTLECWMYFGGNFSSRYDFLSQADLGSSGFATVVDSGQIEFRYTGTSEIQTTASVAGKGWTHIAIVRSGTGTDQTKIYINGVESASGTVSTNYGASEINIAGKRDPSGGSGLLETYLTDVRIVNGSAVYTGNFTPPTSPLTAITNTALLLNFTNAGIIDNAMISDWETAGNAQISTTQSKFGGGSMYFDGSGDYLICNTTPSNYVFGTGDFTIEMWINTSTVSPSYQGIWDSRTADPSVTPHITLVSGAPAWWVSGSARITGATLVTSTWYHLAVVRSSGTTKMYLNGTQTGSSYTDSNNYTSRSSPTIGINFDVIWPFTGYIDDLRITKGVARYTANFTPPSAPFPTK